MYRCLSNLAPKWLHSCAHCSILHEFLVQYSLIFYALPDFHLSWPASGRRKAQGQDFGRVDTGVIQTWIGQLIIHRDANQKVFAT